MVRTIDSSIRFSLRIGGTYTDATSGTWLNFDTIGFIEDWSGLLSEGPIKGDIIEADWQHGAEWQVGGGRYKTYSFEVPFTAVGNSAYEPNIWHSWYNTFRTLKTYRGTTLTMRRQFMIRGTAVYTSTAMGILATDIPATVGIGRVIHGIAVFQNLTGYWYSTDVVTPAPPSVNASMTASDSYVPWGDTITFSDTSTGDPTSWAWNFGAGAVPATAATRGPHIVRYTTPGDSTVNLTAGNLDGNDAAPAWVIHVQPPPLPVASFTSSVVSTVETGTPVIFADTSTSDPAPITSWAWNFGAGATPATANTSGPHSVIYSTNGTSTVTLTVGNIGGTDAATPLALSVFYPKADTLVESFDDQAAFNAMWTYTSSSTANVSLSGSQGVIAWGGTNSSTFLVSKYTYDIVGTSVIMEAVSLSQVNIPGIALNMVTLWDKAVAKYVSFRTTSVSGVPTIQAYNSITGGVGAAIGFTQSAHRWLRISESAGTIFWHTSNDRVAWNQMASIPTASLSGWTPAAIRMGVLADIGLAGVPARKCNIDNINTTGSRLLVGTGLSEPFNTLDYNTWTPTTGIAVTGGFCDVNWGGTVKAESMVTDAVYSLVGSSVSMELVYIDKTVRPFSYHMVEVWNEGMDNSVFFNITYNAALGGYAIQPYRRNAGGWGSPIAFNPDTHPVLRISEASGTITFDSSVDDGKTWTLMGAYPTSSVTVTGPVWLPSAVRVGFGITTPTTTRTGTLTVMKVDSVNTSISMTWNDYPDTYTWQDHPTGKTWADLTETTDLT